MVTEENRLELSVDKIQGCKQTVRVKVPSHRVVSGRLAVAERLGSKLKLPGFRKGHVPMQVVEQRFGDTLDRETLDDLIQKTYNEALIQTELIPISEGQISDVNYKP